ncbi:unnamed protein product [Closterium sp. NIES-53]
METDPHEAVQARHDYASAETHSPMEEDPLAILLATPFATSLAMTTTWSKLQILRNPTSLDFASSDSPSSYEVTSNWSSPPPFARLSAGPILRSGEQPWPQKIKTLADGTLKKYKARWVVRGFERTQFVDYDKTFAPVGRHTSVRIPLCVAVVKQRPLRKINVSNAFLYAIFDVIIYFEQPHAFEEDGDAICLLQKSLYEIKQAPRLWQQYLHTVLIELDFQQLPHDQGMYHLESRGSFILRVAYVDDLLYTRDNTELLDLLEQDIKEKLEVTIDHDFTQFLGLNVSQTTDTIHLFAAKYAETLAKKFAIAPVGITTPFRVPPHNHEPDTTPLSLADHRLY